MLPAKILKKFSAWLAGIRAVNQADAMLESYR